jgi:hypothetical protein
MNMYFSVRFQVLTVSMKMTVFWDVATCSLGDVYQSFRGAYCLHIRISTPFMETVNTSKI